MLLEIDGDGVDGEDIGGRSLYSVNRIVIMEGYRGKVAIFC